MFKNLKVKKELIPSDPRFGCGPSLVRVDHLNNLAATKASILGTGHRKSGIKNLISEIQAGIIKYFDVPNDYQVVLGNGGSTLLFDMIGLGLVKKKSAHFTCGEFSTKWAKSHQMIPWIETEKISAEYGQGIDAKNIDDADILCMTLNETSTGVQNTFLPHTDQDTLLCIDATSGAGQIPCDISKVDVFFFSPQKVFGSEGGIFVAIMSPLAIERAQEINKMDRYIPEMMNWMTAITNSSKNQTYNTPSVSTLFLLNEQIKLMNKVTKESIYKETQEKYSLLYGWAKERPYLDLYISEEKYRSRTVACIDVNEKYCVKDLAASLEKQHIANGIDAYRKLGRNQFRISFFYNIKLDDLKKLTQIISLAIESEPL